MTQDDLLLKWKKNGPKIRQIRLADFEFGPKCGPKFNCICSQGAKIICVAQLPLIILSKNKFVVRQTSLRAIKGKLHRTAVVRPAMMNGLETFAVTKRQEAELEVAEMKMLRFELGVTGVDMIRNSLIRGALHVASMRNKVREGGSRSSG